MTAPTITTDMHPLAAEVEVSLTHPRRWELIRAVQDWASLYNVLPHTRGSVARYVAEGARLDPAATGGEWEWIRWYISENPEVLAYGPTTDAERQAQRDARLAQADAVSRQAAVAVEAGDYDRALQLIDLGVTWTPTSQLWPAARTYIEQRRSAERN
jgi:hypothetical protein